MCYYLVMELQQFQLANGLNVFLLPQPAATSVAIEFMARTGSKNEAPQEAGLAHFLEHMVFRGTKKWPRATQLARVIDSLGGLNNAYTDKENTAFWLKLPPEYLVSGLEIISQMMTAPLFRRKDIDQERGVILEELRMYLDRPMDDVDDLFEQQVLGRNRLGRPIIGYQKTIAGFQAADFQRFYRQWYRSGNASLAIVGAIGDWRQAKDWVKKYFATLPSGRPTGPRVKPKPTSSPLRWQKKDVKQAHFVFGAPTVGRRAEEKWAGKVLAAVLGGGFSSRLTREIRQRRGWAYYLWASQHEYQPGGYFAVKAGVRQDKLVTSLEIIREELRRVGRNLRQSEVQRAKNMVRGRLLMSFENPAQVTSLLNKSWLFERRVLLPADVAAKVAAVEEAAVADFARQYLQPGQFWAAVISTQKPDWS